MDSLYALYELLQPIWVELCCIICFPIGWHLMSKASLVGGSTPPGRGQRSPNQALNTAPESKGETSDQQQEAELRAWRNKQARTPTEPAAFRQVVEALIAQSPNTLVEELTAHLKLHGHSVCTINSTEVILDALAHGQQPRLLDAMYRLLCQELRVKKTAQVCESLFEGHAAAGNEGRVHEIASEIEAAGQKLTARGYALIIKGFLQRSMVDSSLQYVQDMRRHGFTVPANAVSLLIKVSADAGRAMEIFGAVQGLVPLPNDAVLLLFEDCAKRCNLRLADRVEIAARSLNGGSLPNNTYAALLKTYVATADVRAFQLFEEMQKNGVHMSDGLRTAIISRCAETKFLRFAKEVYRSLKEKGELTGSTYSALMKVYAHCGLYAEACDLHPEMLERGVQPDKFMVSCFMKFAVEAGRADLLKELVSSAPKMDIVHYMALIRSAGRDKDVTRAFEAFAQLQASELPIDTTVYNSMLDACVSSGDLKRANTLMDEMREKKMLSIVSYNVMLKGLCASGDVRAAQKLFSGMAKDGLPPDEFSFNCMINAAVCKGNFPQAWETIEAMEVAGVKADNYTASIMMKALKQECKRGDVDRALSFLDRSGVDVCTDRVLLNLVVEICIKYRETKRLNDVVSAWEHASSQKRSTMQPCLHTYASLIKACSVLQDVHRCRDIWKEMTERRGTEPTDIVLGCMLDALVSNDEVDEAVALFRQWKTTVGPNTVLYATLVKGFASKGRADDAMAMWREIRQEGCKMNSVLYNTLMDAQARLGGTNEIHELFDAMEGDGVAPDSRTYCTMVKGYCMKGDLEKAIEVFRQMQTSGMAQECVVYNTILDGCNRHNRMDLAKTILQEFEDKCIIPTNFTLGILVKMYSRRRQLDKAFEVVYELPKKHGFAANMQTKACLISACVSSQSYERGLEVLKDMTSTGEACAEPRAYGMMISALTRAGQVEKAVELVEEAYGLKTGRRMLMQKQNISDDDLGQLIRGLGQKGLHEVGQQLLTDLRRASVPLGGKFLGSVLESTRQGGGPSSGQGGGGGGGGARRPPQQQQRGGAASGGSWR